MKHLLKLEQAAQLLFCIAVLWWLPETFSWWICLLLFFAPDLGMIGYLAGNRMGAWLYNFTHHKMVCLTVIALGYLLSANWLLVTGILFYAHACFDRLAGYGLKYEQGFAYTHLGVIGKKV